MSDPRYLTIQQAAHVAGVSRRTVYNWLDAGKLAHERLVSGRVRILAESLWLPRPTAEGTPTASAAARP